MKLKEVSASEKKQAEKLFKTWDDDLQCALNNHIFTVTPKNRIRCIACGLYRRVQQKEMVTFGVCLWYWKLVRDERHEQEWQDWAYF